MISPNYTEIVAPPAVAGTGVYAIDVVVANWSGNIVKISGQPVTISGNVVNISGAFIELNPLTNVITGPLVQVTSVSGGIELSSGVVSTVTVKAWSKNSGDIYVGGNTPPWTPYSGSGFILEKGEAVSTDVNNLNKIHVFATRSGERVSFVGIQQ